MTAQWLVFQDNHSYYDPVELSLQLLRYIEKSLYVMYSSYVNSSSFNYLHDSTYLLLSCFFYVNIKETHLSAEFVRV